MSITQTAAGTAAAGSTSVAPSYPSGVAAGRVAVLTVVCKPNTATINSPGGDWVELGQFAGGTGTQGADTGATRVAVFAEVLAGDESGSVTVNITNGNSSGGVIDIYQADSGFVTPSTSHFTGGQDTTHGTSCSITGSADIDVDAGDQLLFAFASTSNATNNITFSSDTLTATGCTFGTLDVETIFRSNTGNDIAMQRMNRPCSTGPSSAAPVWTATASANTSGAGAFVRLVEEDITPQTGSDQGTGGESAVISATITSTDQGTGAEQVGDRTLSQVDSGTGAEVDTITAGLSSADDGTGAESVVVAAVVVGADEGIGAEAYDLDTGSVTKAGADEGTGGEVALVVDMTPGNLVLVRR